MKKKYFAPEMEEVKLDDPVVLAMGDTEGGSIGSCPSKECTSDECPLDGD